MGFVEVVVQFDWLVASASPMHVDSNSCLIVVYSHWLLTAFLLQIILENHDKGKDCLMSVDGTDFQIPEHSQIAENTH